MRTGIERIWKCRIVFEIACEKASKLIAVNEGYEISLRFFDISI